MAETLIKIFFSIVLIRLSINGYRLIRVSFLQKQYHAWLSSKNEDWSMVEKKKEVIELWKLAGVEDGSLPITEPAGYGKLQSYTVSMFRHFPHHDIKMATISMEAFYQAIGVYKKRIIDTINPIEWVILIVYLPERILKAIGLTPNKGLSNFFKGVWWIFGIFCTFILATYPSEIRLMFDHLIFGK